MERRVTVAEANADKRLAAIEKRLIQIAFLLAYQAPPEVRDAAEQISNGNGLKEAG